MGWLQSLAAELAISVSDGAVWLSIGQGLLFGAVCLALGIFVARLTGFLRADAPAGETLGIGLAAGLVIVAAWWAAVVSAGRSSFTPVAVGFAISIVLAVARRRRSSKQAPSTASGAGEASSGTSGRRRDMVIGLLGGAGVVVVLALLYGSTLTLRPRDDVQPIEFNDVAYYSILGANLASTGTESLHSPSGFSDIEGLPAQTWYHWGELWLGAAVISVFGASALDARHLVVLPLLVLAAGAVTGTVLRRVTGSATRGAFLVGFLACLFLAPVPFIPGKDFSAWAVGLLFGITLYGLATVAVLLAMYSLAVGGKREASWPLAVFVASVTAAIVPAHVGIAALAAVGAGSVWAIRIGQSVVSSRRLPVVAPVWRRIYLATGLAIVATVGWGLLTGHGIGASSSSPEVASFNASWREAVAITAVCSGAFLAIVIAWFVVRGEASIERGLYVGTAIILVAGAIVWGALLGDFTSFHLFFGGIAVFATPVAAVAVWRVWLWLRSVGHPRLAVVVLLLFATQLEFGLGLGVLRAWRFGPTNYPPVPVATLAAIRSLPDSAKLAYACLPFEEIAFWDAQLLAITAHAERPVVPMCFEAETFGLMTGTPISREVPNPLFLDAPQRRLYPTWDSRPEPATVSAFLKAHGIEYIYADALHPNTLVPDAVQVVTDGETRVLRIP